jgi:two-component system, cell cycle response regulator DivK
MGDERRILVVEDNELNLKLVRDVLGHAGFDVVEARTGQQGIELAAACDPALILMDLQLPDIDGVEALGRIRGSEHARRVPIVAVTAFAMPADRERALGAGFDGYMEKPISVRELPRQVAEYLAKENGDG